MVLHWLESMHTRSGTQLERAMVLGQQNMLETRPLATHRPAEAHQRGEAASPPRQFHELCPKVRWERTGLAVHITAGFPSGLAFGQLQFDGRQIGAACRGRADGHDGLGSVPLIRLRRRQRRNTHLLQVPSRHMGSIRGSPMAQEHRRDGGERVHLCFAGVVSVGLTEQVCQRGDRVGGGGSLAES